MAGTGQHDLTLPTREHFAEEHARGRGEEQAVRIPTISCAGLIFPGKREIDAQGTGKPLSRMHVDI